MEQWGEVRLEERASAVAFAGLTGSFSGCFGLGAFPER